MATQEKCNTPTSKDKWIISVISALLFLLIASPFMYMLTNRLTNSFGMITSIGGCPNIAGLIIHTLVFLLIVRLLMW